MKQKISFLQLLTKWEEHLTKLSKHEKIMAKKKGILDNSSDSEPLKDRVYSQVERENNYVKQCHNEL